MPTPEDRPCPPTNPLSSGDHPSHTQDDTAIPAPVAIPETLAPAAGTLADFEPVTQIIAGYEILEELGRGGMGIVYKARQTSLKRIVALKRIRAGTDADSQDLVRFLAEAESVARLQHPNIVQIHEVGEHQGLPFFSLEYVEGGSLDKRLACTALPPAVAARLVEAIARGVHDAHQHGLIHRDLKPANVLLAGGPATPLEQCVPKVSDFGLVKRLDDNSGQTQSGTVIGTPAYMAPEQAEGRIRDVGLHTDVYALGAILYECLTGRPPFQADSPLETLTKVIQDEPAPPRKLHRKIPRDLETICLKCLHKTPARRYASALDLADDLHRFLSFETIRARRVSVAERGWRWMRRRPATCLAALFLVLLLTGAAVGYRLWQQAQQSAGHDAGAAGLVVEYYESVLRPDDAPQGVGRLSEEEALRRPQAFKLHRRGDQVEQVNVLGQQGRLLRHNPFHLLAGGGTPTTTLLREASYHFVHDDKGQVSEVEAHDSTGHVLWNMQRLPSDRVRYAEQPGPWGEPTAKAALFQVIRDGAGELREVWLIDTEGRRTPARHNVHGLSREIDAAAEIRLTLLDSAGQPVGAVPRWVVRPWNAVGRSEEAYFDAAGKPIAGAAGCPRWLWSQEGPRALRGAGLDAKGQPMQARDGSYSSLRRFDGQGREIELAWFGADGTPLVAGFGSAKVTSRYDARGAMLEKSFWVLDERGNYVLRRRADAADHTLEEAYFTPEGRPTLHRDGYHRSVARYDERGHRVEWAFFGLDGKPCLHKDGNHRGTARYDERGNCVETTWFGLDGQPTLLIQGANKGCAKLTWEYDDKGKLRQRGYFVPDGKGGVALRRRADAANHTLEEAYFTAEGRPTLHKNGFHRFTARYDGRGKLIEGAYFGLDGKPCLHKDGHHRWTARYDARGNQVEVVFFSLDGKPGQNKDGSHRWTVRYDGRGKRVEQAFFGPDGKPCLYAHGYHRLTLRYDERGKLVEEAYFGLDGKPAARIDKGTNKGCAKLTWVYDSKGELRQRGYFVPDGKGGCVLRRRTDTANRTLEFAYFTSNGQPTLNGEGIHRYTARYDKRGHRIEGCAFGLDDKPCLFNSGYHRWTARYDERGHRIEGCAFGLDGKPCLYANGYHRWTYRYDKRDKLVEMAYFGADGKPCLHKDGYHRATRDYDERGRLVSTAVFDVAGKRLHCRILVGKVSPGSLADKAGVREGDVLVRYAGKELTSAALFWSFRDEEGASDPPRKLELRREGKPLTVELAPGATGLTLLNKASPADASP